MFKKRQFITLALPNDNTMPDPSGGIFLTMPQPNEDQGLVRFDRSNCELSIPDLFERQVRAYPGRIAVGCDRNSLSYDDLNRISNRIAHAILRCRGDRREPIALLFRQGPTAVAATIGLLKSGNIYVPLEPNQPVHELQKIFAHCQPGLIICNCETEALARSLVDDAGRHLNVETAVSDESEIDPGLDILPDRICYVFYTSGTTGPAKGVFDNHRNVLHNVMRYTNNLGVGAKDRLSLIQSCSFSGTVSSLFSALLNGAAVCPFDLQGQGIARLASWVERQRITVFHSTPTLFEQLMATGRKFDGLRMVRIEGDRAELRQISLFQSHFDADCVLVNGLGLTEAGIVRQYFLTPRTKIDGDVVPVGQAIEDMEINLVDNEGCNVDPGTVGEIVIRSRYLACGYWLQPKLTEAAFVPDPAGGGMRSYRTSDLGRLRADGCLDYLGRKDFQAKLRGQWVDTAKIESALCAMESINQALVLIRDGGLGTQQLTAYLVAAGAQPSVDGIRRALGRTLPTVMIPSRYVFIAGMPLDRNGKVDRRRFPAPERHRPILKNIFVAPRSQEEQVVAECFRAVLKIDRAGVHDDFLDLGGDSLLATELSMMIEERLEVECPAALMGRPSSVASIVSRLGQGLPESALVPIQIGDGRTPLFCIHNYSGDVSDYHRLAACLEPNRTVYGLQSREFSKAGIRDVRVEDMAAAYLMEIIAVDADGPYYLCGDCFGGTIAFEIAQQLRRQGRNVALLALIDTAFPGGFLYKLANRFLDPYRRRRLSKLTARQWLQHFVRRLQAFTRWVVSGSKRLLISAIERALGRRHQPDSHRLGILQRNKLAQARYNPGQYDDEIVLICPGPPHNQRGWIGVAADGCHVIEVPLDGQPEQSPHLTHDPYVGTLATHISKFLEA
jgi:amino acid adenylation domain-containing protein